MLVEHQPVQQLQLAQRRVQARAVPEVVGAEHFAADLHVEAPLELEQQLLAVFGLGVGVDGELAPHLLPNRDDLLVLDDLARPDVVPLKILGQFPQFFYHPPVAELGSRLGVEYNRHGRLVLAGRDLSIHFLLQAVVEELLEFAYIGVLVQGPADLNPVAEHTSGSCILLGVFQAELG